MKSKLGKNSQLNTVRHEEKGCAMADTGGF